MFSTLLIEEFIYLYTCFVYSLIVGICLDYISNLTFYYIRVEVPLKCFKLIYFIIVDEKN